jgi:rhodanese-related sulfurtransferase
MYNTMNIVLKMGAGALIAGATIMAASCAESGAPNQRASASSANMPAASPAQNPNDRIPRVSVEETKKLIVEGKAVLVDVRGSEAYKKSHIKDALNVPLDKLKAGDFKDLPKDKLIIAYCACGAEQTSGDAALLLQQNGFKDASALLGGIHAWESSGNPMVKSSPTPTPANKK